MSAAVMEKHRCVGRKCGEANRMEGRAIRYAEAQCKEMCAADETLCGKCMKLQSNFVTGANKGKYHGILGGPIPEKSHIRGSAWNIATAEKEAKKLDKMAAAVETIAENAEEASDKAVSVAKKATTAAKKAGKEAADAEKAAKKAEKAAADAEKAAKKMVKEATADMKEYLGALSGAANVYAGLVPRKAHRATTAKRTSRKTSKTSSSRRRRRSSSGTGNPFRAGAAVPPSPPMIYRPVSRASTSSSGYVPRNLSGGPARAPASRGASPSERSEGSRANIQDRILADLMQAQMMRGLKD